MVPLDSPFRIATASDGPVLARLVNIAGEGLPFYFWAGMVRDGEDPWEVGRERQAKRAADGQIVVADYGEGAIAGLTGYEIGPDPEPIDDDMSPLIRPLQELENLAHDSWYVNVLACFPEHRGKGLGSSLLEIADALGRAAGRPAMSVIVAGDNAGARRLYERHGYRETARRPCVREGWQTTTEQWVLLMKPR